MARIVVIGGGVGGLTSAMLLARDGHEVTVLERDAAEPPATADDAWNSWERRGVNQFRMIHLFAPRFRALLDAELPDVIEEAEALGAIRFNAMQLVPEEMIGGYREADAEFTMRLRAPPRDGDRAVARVRAHARARGAARRRGRGAPDRRRPRERRPECRRRAHRHR